MKKFSTVLAFITMAGIICPSSACAVNNKKAESLEQEAYTLGATTDYMGVAAYKYSYNRPMPFGVYEDYVSRCTSLNKKETDWNEIVLNTPTTIGISILNVLAHNGVISPADISADAQKMTDITYSEEVGRIISNYQAQHIFFEMNTYLRYLYSLPLSESLDMLISTAEKCEENGKYFLITLNCDKKDNEDDELKDIPIAKSDSYTQDMTGIGISEGSWTFNGKSFDKCILTLDPNSQDENGNAAGFNENNCIYINSETKDCYIPAYELSNEGLRIATIDDDTILNFNGLINPYNKIETDISDIYYISLNDLIRSKKYTVTDGEKVLIPEDDHTVKADKIHIESFGCDHAGANIITSEKMIEYYCENKDYSFLDVDIDKSNIYIKNTSYTAPEGYGHEPMEVSLFSSMNKDCSKLDPYCFWSFDSTVESDLAIETVDEGMILKSDKNILSSVYISCYEYEESIDEKTGRPIRKIVEKPLIPDDEEFNPKYQNRFINCEHDVLVKVDESKHIRLLVDDNDDGVFDFEAQPGDVNMDGMIDASDASAVLEAYSVLSTKFTSREKITVDYRLADINNDGLIDAQDASAILTIYGDSSTK